MTFFFFFHCGLTHSKDEQASPELTDRKRDTEQMSAGSCRGADLYPCERLAHIWFLNPFEKPQTAHHPALRLLLVHVKSDQLSFHFYTKLFSPFYLILVLKMFFLAFFPAS